MLKTTFTVILIFVLGTLQAQLKEFDVKVMETPETQVVQANAKYPDNAMILVYSSLPDLFFRSTIGGISKQQYNKQAGRYEILISPLKQILFVSKKGFAEKRIALLNPKAKDVFYYTVESEGNSYELYHNQSKGMLQITTQPKRATVKIDGLELAQKTPIKLSYNSQEIKIELQKENYADFDTIFKILPNQQNILQVRLTQISRAVTIHSKPENALVIIDGQRLGRTPLTTYLSAGAHKIKLIKSEHHNLSKEIVVRDNGKNKFKLKLEKNKIFSERQSTSMQRFRAYLTFQYFMNPFMFHATGQQSIGLSDFTHIGLQTSANIKVRLFNSVHFVSGLNLSVHKYSYETSVPATKVKMSNSVFCELPLLMHFYLNEDFYLGGGISFYTNNYNLEHFMGAIPIVLGIDISDKSKKPAYFTLRYNAQSGSYTPTDFHNPFSNLAYVGFSFSL